jgi:NAD(P)-dependent dehydrogenase (short-subunit alcohol dehydrogenase family)
MAMYPNDLLAGLTALVTGASSGIGAASAAALAAAGARLILHGRDEARLEALAARMPGARILPADLGQTGAAGALADAAEAVGPVDVLVNSAGFGLTKRSAALSDADIDGMLAVNVRAPLILAARIGEKMQARGRGSIVTLSSVVGSLGTPYQAGYAATKGAVEAMTRSLAREFGSSGVRVNAIAPGLIATEMWGPRLDDETFKAQAVEHVTLRRWGEAGEIADAVVFLASDLSRYITGEVITIDGGLTHTGDLIPARFFGRRS